MVYRGHVRNGVVVLDKPCSFPDGAEVQVNVIAPQAAEQLDQRNLPDGTVVSLAISQSDSEINSDEQWDHTPEGVADWLRWYDSLQPFVMTGREEADAEDPFPVCRGNFLDCLRTSHAGDG